MKLYHIVLLSVTHSFLDSFFGLHVLVKNFHNFIKFTSKNQKIVFVKKKKDLSTDHYFRVIQNSRDQLYSFLCVEVSHTSLICEIKKKHWKGTRNGQTSEMKIFFYLQSKHTGKVEPVSQRGSRSPWWGKGRVICGRYVAKIICVKIVINSTVILG